MHRADGARTWSGSSRENTLRRPRTILVIDDSPLIRQLIRVALGGSDWRIDTAESGADGLEQAARERPDAILLDVEMPDLSGPATLQRLRAEETTCRVPVLFLTAHTGTDRAELESLDAAGVIAKPFDVETLAEDVEAALGWER